MTALIDCNSARQLAIAATAMVQKTEGLDVIIDLRTAPRDISRLTRVTDNYVTAQVVTLTTDGYGMKFGLDPQGKLRLLACTESNHTGALHQAFGDILYTGIPCHGEGVFATIVECIAANVEAPTFVSAA